MAFAIKESSNMKRLILSIRLTFASQKSTLACKDGNFGKNEERKGRSPGMSLRQENFSHDNKSVRLALELTASDFVDQQDQEARQLDAKSMRVGRLTPQPKKFTLADISSVDSP